MVRHIQLNHQADLAQIAFAFGRACGGFGSRQRRQKNTGKNCNERDKHHAFNEGKSACRMPAPASLERLDHSPNLPFSRAKCHVRNGKSEMGRLMTERKGEGKKPRQSNQLSNLSYSF